MGLKKLEVWSPRHFISKKGIHKEQSLFKSEREEEGDSQRTIALQEKERERERDAGQPMGLLNPAGGPKM